MAKTRGQTKEAAAAASPTTPTKVKRSTTIAKTAEVPPLISLSFLPLPLPSSLLFLLSPPLPSSFSSFDDIQHVLCTCFVSMHSMILFVAILCVDLYPLRERQNCFGI